MKTVKDPFGMTIESPDEIAAFERWFNTLDQDRQADLHTPERAAHDNAAERQWAWEQLVEAIDNEPEQPEWMEGDAA